MIGNSLGGSYQALLKDIVTEKNYTFYINMYAEGGRTFRVGPLEIMIGCHPDIPIVYDSLPELNKTYPLREDRDKIRITFNVDGIRSTNPYCEVLDYELIKSTYKPDPTTKVGEWVRPNDVFMF